MAQYRKKPVVIEAIRWMGNNIHQIRTFMAPLAPVYMAGYKNSDDIFGVQTLEGLMVAHKGDWIIKGVKGELYPCKPDIFDITYDPAGEPPMATRRGKGRE